MKKVTALLLVASLVLGLTGVFAFANEETAPLFPLMLEDGEILPDGGLLPDGSALPNYMSAPAVATPSQPAQEQESEPDPDSPQSPDTQGSEPDSRPEIKRTSPNDSFLTSGRNGPSEDADGPQNAAVQENGRTQVREPKSLEPEENPWWQEIPVGRLFTPVANFFSGDDEPNGDADILIVPDVFSVSTPSTTKKITGIASGSEIGGANTTVRKNGGVCEPIYDLDVFPGDEIMIYLERDFFEWENDDKPDAVTTSQMHQGKIKLRTTGSKSSKVFDSISLKSDRGKAAIRVYFKTPQPIRRELEFKTVLYFTVNGSRHTGSEAELSGTIANDEVEFYDSHDEIDISDGIIGIAGDILRKMRIHIGEGVYVNVSSIRKNARFYGVAVLDEYSRTDDETIDDYPDIVEVYTLYTIGLNGAGNTVELEDSPRNYYVYDSELEYLGRSHQKLPFSNKYYLATKELDIQSEDTDDEFPDEPPILEPPELEEDPASNENHNPFTGR